MVCGGLYTTFRIDDEFIYVFIRLCVFHINCDVLIIVLNPEYAVRKNPPETLKIPHFHLTLRSSNPNKSTTIIFTLANVLNRNAINLYLTNKYFAVRYIKIENVTFSYLPVT